jgi:hypothetical protein
MVPLLLQLLWRALLLLLSGLGPEGHGALQGACDTRQ